MGRSIVAVIVGYLVMVVLIIGLFTTAYLMMGTERAFQPGSFEPSGSWLAVSFALGLLGAIAAGWVCALIARGSKAPQALAVLVVVLGVLFAIPDMMAGDSTTPATRSGDLGNFEAMAQARQPLWVSLVNPFLGAVGVLAGAKLKKS